MVGWRWADQSAIGYPPTVTAGLVMVPENRSLIALDLESGTPKWSVSLGASTNAPITVSAGMVFVTTTDNVLHAIDLTSRQERWAMPGTADGAQVSVEGRTAYLGTQKQEFIALDKTTPAPELLPDEGAPAGSSPIRATVTPLKYMRGD